jgi:single-strand DNA-binding protein
MASFNKVILVGNLTADPELRQTTNGVSVCSFSLAINRKTKTDSGQNVDFINVVAWRQTAEFVAKYFKKGRPLLVCGQLQTRTWTDAHGNKRYSTEVMADEVAFVESKGGDETDTGAYVPSAYTSPPSQASFEVVEDDDDLPF